MLLVYHYFYFRALRTISTVDVFIQCQSITFHQSRDTRGQIYNVSANNPSPPPPRPLWPGRWTDASPSLATAVPLVSTDTHLVCTPRRSAQQPASGAVMSEQRHCIQRNATLPYQSSTSHSLQIMCSPSSLCPKKSQCCQTSLAFYCISRDRVEPQVMYARQKRHGAVLCTPLPG